MLTWAYTLLFGADDGTHLGRPGPGRNLLLPEELRAAKLSLTSPEIVETLRGMSLLHDIQHVRNGLRRVPVPVVTVRRAYPPRHPVLQELLARHKRGECLP